MNVSAEYQAVGQLSQESLVTRYSALVRRVAYHLAGRLPDSVDVEDLIQAGMLGLIEAAGKYRGEQGASFETYASIRMRGAMLDELRRTDWVPRSVHRSIRDMVEAVHRVEARLGRHGSDREIAEEMEVSLERYYEIAREAVSCRMFSTEELAPSSDSAVLSSGQEGPERSLEAHKAQDALAEQITRLPEREALVMSLYYTDELNMREIGEVLGVSESRVCQLHGQALARLRARLVEWRG
ncbi:MAG: RNA polymerase sigma factor FliA [Wenzhouxiangella sp.]|nr:RNA polymerase sigma factor FliA [Wenzhouxiangella sp.]